MCWEWGTPLAVPLYSALHAMHAVVACQRGAEEHLQFRVACAYHIMANHTQLRALGRIGGGGLKLGSKEDEDPYGGFTRVKH